MQEIAKISEDTLYGLMENVIAKGDLSKLSNKERVTYYKEVCQSLDLNPLTRPFQFISFDGKLTLYAAKDCTEQLRTKRKVSIHRLDKDIMQDVYVVTAHAVDASGRNDIATGAVATKGLQGKALANAFKIAETQAKRRVTLSICGLGWTDESEIPDVPNAKAVEVDFETGEIKSMISQEVRTVDKPVIPMEGKHPPHRDELMVAIKHAANMTELKNLYGKAYTLHCGDLDRMTDITELKDIRKKEIEEIIEQVKFTHREWIEEATDVQIEIMDTKELTNE